MPLTPVPSDARTLEIAPYTGGWVTVRAGDEVRITDVEGSQVADMFAVSSADETEWLSPAHTRGAEHRLFPRPGGRFVTNRFRPILTFVADRSPGVHDMLWRACDPHLYALVGVTDPHPSCTANFRLAAAEFGWTPEEVPDPVDWFQNTPVQGDLELGSGPGPSRAGDHVVLRAEMDLHLVVTSCSWDLPGSINGERCTPIRVEVGPPGSFA